MERNLEMTGLGGRWEALNFNKGFIYHPKEFGFHLLCMC